MLVNFTRPHWICGSPSTFWTTLVLRSLGVTVFAAGNGRFGGGAPAGAHGRSLSSSGDAPTVFGAQEQRSAASATTASTFEGRSVLGMAVLPVSGQVGSGYSISIITGRQVSTFGGARGTRPDSTHASWPFSTAEWRTPVHSQRRSLQC